MKHLSTINICSFVLGVFGLATLYSCAVTPIQSSAPVIPCAETFREPATDLPFNLNLRRFLHVWNSRTCNSILSGNNNGTKQEAVAAAIDLATQEQREGRVAIANLIMAQVRIGTFQDASEPSRFLAQLNKLLSKERAQAQNMRIPDDQIENYIQLSALTTEARASGGEQILPKELWGPLSYLPDPIKIEFKNSLKTASQNELITIEGQIEELYARDGELKWKNEVEESLNRCRGHANLNQKLFYGYKDLRVFFENKSVRATPSRLFFSGMPLSSI